MHLVQRKELKILNLCSSLFSVGSLVVLVLTYSNNSETVEMMVVGFDSRLDLRYLTTFSNVFAIILLLVHQYYSTFIYKKSLTSLGLHILVHLVSPIFPSSTLLCVPYSYEETCYSVNDLLILVMFLRIILLYMALLQFTIYFDIFCFTKLRSLGPTYFASKSFYSQHKITMSLFIIIFGNHFCAFSLSVLESRGGNQDLKNLTNANWCAFISGFSIGLGDFTPFTVLGRTLVVFWIFFCSAFAWYFALAVSDFFTMNQIQFLVYKDINKMEKAVKFIESWMARTSFEREKQEFREMMSRQYTSPNNYGTFIIDLYETPPRDFRTIFIKLNLLEKNYDSLFSSIQAVSNKFNNLFLAEGAKGLRKRR